MGQYHYVLNLDRKEYLHPHRFGDGLKLLEFGSSGEGTMTGLAVLLAVSNGRGGGDLSMQEYDRDKGEMVYTAERVRVLDEYVVGRWGGDRIAIVGDYYAEADIPGVTDVLVADTGGYRYDSAKGEAAYDAPIYGDVPWNQQLKPVETSSGQIIPALDLGWTDISDIVIEAMDCDGYLRQAAQEPVTNIHGEKIQRGTDQDGNPIYMTRRSGFSGGEHKPAAKLTDTGQIVRLDDNID